MNVVVVDNNFFKERQFGERFNTVYRECRFNNDAFKVSNLLQLHLRRLGIAADMLSENVTPCGIEIVPPCFQLVALIKHCRLRLFLSEIKNLIISDFTVFSKNHIEVIQIV